MAYCVTALIGESAENSAKQVDRSIWQQGMSKRLLLYATALCAVICWGCTKGNNSTAAADGPAEQDAIRVDLNIYTPGTIPQGIGERNKVALDIAREWEKQHAGRHIRYQQMINTGSGEGEWLKTQLLGGKAPEIVSQNAEIAWQDVGKGWYVPLDEYLQRPTPYVEGQPKWIDTFDNQALVGAKRAPDGKLYCISIDIVETGLFYNKRILKEAGVEKVPETWAEMYAAFEKVEKAGKIPMTAVYNLASDWGQDIVFEMLYHDILADMDIVPSSGDAEAYLGHYLDAQEAGFLFTKGFFTRRDPRWREQYRLLKEWRGYWAKEQKNTDPDRLFLTGRMAMLWNGSWFIRRLAMDPYVDFEWGVAYIPTLTKESSPFASGTPATVIGGAAVQLHVTNSAVINNNVEDCIDFLMYLSAPRNIERLSKESLVYIPNIKGAEMDPRLAPFKEIFARRYCAIKWLDSMDGEYKKFFRRTLDYYLNDGVDLDGFLEMMEGNFAQWVDSHRQDAAWNFEPMEKIWQEREARLSHELEPAP